VFRSLLLELYKISHEFEAKTSEYTHSQYQCYIGARCIQGCDPRYAFMLGSGQGKSIIALLMAAYYKTHGRKVTIVSASKQLKM
jgi:ERCC4-related helicase